MFGFTEGTRHYIQYDLEQDGNWQDLLFVDSTTGDTRGLWCSQSYSRANTQVESLMSDSSMERSQYRIVKRTWSETIIEHDPSRVQHVDSDEDEDSQDPSDAEYTTDDEVDGDAPDTGFESDSEPPVNTPVADPTK